MIKEKWKTVPEFDMYEISNYGDLRKNGEEINGWYQNNRRMFAFKDGDKHVHKYANRLVAEAFIKNPNGYKIVYHKDGNLMNDRVDNLKWISAKESVSRNCDYKNRKIYVLKDSNIIKTFNSIKECVEWLKSKGYEKASVCAVSQVLRKIHKSYKGYTFKYVDNKYEKAEEDI